MAELAAPVQRKAEQGVVATIETAMLKLSKIAFAELGDDAIKVSDQIAAFRTMAQMQGWNASEKTNLSGELKALNELLSTLRIETAVFSSEVTYPALRTY